MERIKRPKLLPTLQTLAILRYMRYRNIKRLGGGINERHLKVVLMRVGLCGYREHTFTEIAKEFGFSRCRGNQIFDKCLNNISVHCKRKGVSPFDLHIFD